MVRPKTALCVLIGTLFLLAGPAPKVCAVTIADVALTTCYISPNRNGVKDSTQISFTLSEACTVKAELHDHRTHSLLETLVQDSSVAAGSFAFVWRGLRTQSEPYAEGPYDVRVLARAGASTAEAETTIHVDLTRPALISTLGDTLQGSLPYKNGETVRFTTVWDSEMEEVTADFSQVDTRYFPGAEFTQSNGQGTYLIVYNIADDNERRDGYSIPIKVTAADSAGNVSTDQSFEISLRNGAPSLSQLSVLGQDNVYRNGDSVWVSSSWSSSIGIQTVDLDLSSIDSFFSGLKVKHARTSDTSFVSSYKLTTTNSRLDGTYVVSVTGIDSTGAEATVDTLKLTLDNSRPGALDLGSYPSSVRTDSVSLSGTAAEPGHLFVTRDQRVIASALTDAQGEFTVSVPLVERENTLRLYSIDFAGNPSDTVTVVVIRVVSDELELDIEAPFEPGSSFKVYLARDAAAIEIEIFSLNADLVAVLEDRGPRDNYSLQWSGKNLAGELVNSGPFFAKVVVTYQDGVPERKIVPFLFRR